MVNINNDKRAKILNMHDGLVIAIYPGFNSVIILNFVGWAND